MKEIWKDIPNYEGLYQASNLGRIKSLSHLKIIKNTNCDYVSKSKEIIIKHGVHKLGYLYVYLYKKAQKQKHYIHQLVARAFLSNENQYKEINHIDENKSNNNVNNLEWSNRSKNLAHSVGKKVNQYDIYGNFIKAWEFINDIEDKTGVKHSSIIGCCKHQYGHKTAGGYKWEYANE